MRTKPTGFWTKNHETASIVAIADSTSNIAVLNETSLEDVYGGTTHAVVHTGRRTSVFGFRVCQGQVFNLPGESQCV